MTQYYIGLSDFSSAPKTETFSGSRVYKCKTQLGICRGSVYVLLKLLLCTVKLLLCTVKIRLGKTWCLYLKLYDYEGEQYFIVLLYLL